LALAKSDEKREDRGGLYKMMKIIAFIIVYNEEEIIAKCIKNAREQGLDVIVIDNGCVDRTIEIVKAQGVPIYEHKTDKYNVFEVNKWAISKVREIGCDWLVLKDADEIFETYDGRKIAEAVTEADIAGYNCMRFESYEFWPTVIDDLDIKDFTERIRYYSYFGDKHLKMIKNCAEIGIDNPHRPYGQIKESPERLVLKHYKFISLEQGRRKVKTRLSRYHYPRKGNGHSRQYNEFTSESKFYVLEEMIYPRLFKFNGILIKKKVFDGWRGY